MPVFVEDPAQFSKERLKSELTAHNVELPPAESKKHVYVELYLKYVKKNSTDFSSDEEEDHLNDSSVEEREESLVMADVDLLTDDQLKAKLLQYGFKTGPIVASTRALYEKKLHMLMDTPTKASLQRVNGTADGSQYSDSEEEEDKESESEIVSKTETSKMTSKGKTLHKSSDSSQNGSLVQIASPYRSFSISQMVEEIENRFSPQSQHTEIERRSSQRTELTVDSGAQREPATDVLTEMFAGTVKTPTGIYATKRRPIKGAAGRPVQFKYQDLPLLSPTTLERQEIQQRLVPLWVQTVVFLLVVCLFCLIYLYMKMPLFSPLTALLDGLHEEPGFISSSQATPATDVAA
ncbi:lamina-associated polypeptide 2, isoforms beta/gamma-like isoform X2 [Xyrauchen texanus]|uniref:lamina-associated polypeptide 2, isoforms beta/gamma-like isoform X2 n=1 Tax=Xyrauchen texanus TaxID=154827 RepID=UPI002241EF05|nr:lamina-associated polypeptide 2, isoforms beta/gamma-like isoform X2 [Xyrauchen texanus]